VPDGPTPDGPTTVPDGPTPGQAGPPRRAVVTGASRGLGLEWVRQLLAAGWDVVACARRPAGADDLAKIVADAPDRCVIEQLDVAEDGAATRCAEAVAGRWDGVDLLVNNAGVNAADADRSRSAGPLPDLDAGTLLEVLRVNAVAPVAVTQAFAPLLTKAGRATVVNTSSRLGSLAIASSPDDPYERDYGYRMSKAALNMATVQLAGDLRAAGVTVVAMSPGWVRTDMTSDRADLTVGESVAGQLATAVALTPADSGRYLAHTGETIPW
jgi:NAD(P)-dependent dehydrogenase (short-subunit alcohol dehydrogenase family)